MNRVAYSAAEGVATLMLNRPEKRNALDDQTITELRHYFSQAAHDDAIRVIVLRGAGTDFCAGADLSQLEKIAAGGTEEENLADAMKLGALFLQIRAIGKPVIAAVQGNALAGGAGLATVCDLVVAHEDARFGFPEVKLGFVPAMVMAMLVRIVGEKAAFELAAVGDAIDAREALRIDLVNKVAGDDFDDVVAKLARDLTKRSASALRLIKNLQYGIDGMGFEEAIKRGAEVNVIARATDDCRRGVRKFLESKKK